MAEIYCLCSYLSSDYNHDLRLFIFYVLINFLLIGLFLQAFLGCLLFGETLSMRWLFGTSLILTGLILVHYNSEPLTKDHLDVKKD